jgi:hypothetical protein
METTLPTTEGCFEIYIDIVAINVKRLPETIEAIYFSSEMSNWQWPSRLALKYEDLPL